LAYVAKRAETLNLAQGNRFLDGVQDVWLGGEDALEEDANEGVKEAEG
jgi:hypothetical protein